MTNTARGSKRLFWLYAVMTALSLLTVVLDDGRDWSSWLRFGLTLTWGTLAVLHLRSWRILSRQGSERGE